MVDLVESDFEPRRFDADWRQKIHQYLTAGECQFRFQKQDGTVREMRCTLQESVIPETSGAPKNNPDNLAVFDVEVNGWRTIKFEKIMDFKVLV